jgi:general secretion pathway protein I
MSSAVRAWLCAKPRPRGFTLLEVLVALAIIGVALAAALRGALALTQGAEEAQLRLLATASAENRLNELRLARQQLALGDSEFDCSQGGAQLRCRQAVKTTFNPFFRRVEVRVFRADDEARSYAELIGVLPTNQ